MKRSEKIHVSFMPISHHGTTNGQINFPDGRQISFKSSPWESSRSFSFNKELDIRNSEGDLDYYLTPAQYKKWVTFIDDLNTNPQTQNA